MAPEQAYGRPILVTGAAGDIGAIGRNLTAMLLEKGHVCAASLDGSSPASASVAPRH